MLDQFDLLGVEDFFGDKIAGPWQTIGEVQSVLFDANRSALVVTLKPDDANITRTILLEIPDARIIRLRFHPDRPSLSDYTDENSRTVVMNTMTRLRNELRPARVSLTLLPSGADAVTATAFQALVSDTDGIPHSRITISRRPYSVRVERPDAAGDWVLVIEDASQPIKFRPALDYSVDGVTTRTYQIIKAYKKPPDSSCYGFGEKPGRSLCKDNKQLAYINYDNWGMMDWYKIGPFDDREPLYNSNPFFLQYAIASRVTSVFGLLLDNTGPAYMDIAKTRSDVIQVGTLYDEIDVYVFLGDRTADILGRLTDLVGTARLKPRYVLGYHQGCYGYETEAHIRKVAEQYRQAEIPIDGLHIDVDLQDSYRTFTIDQNRFPDFPKLMEDMRENGFKCSTNITPIVSDEDGGYSVYEDGATKGCFIFEKRCTPGKPAQSPTNRFYRGGVRYGGTEDYWEDGVYPDLGRQEVRRWWGVQYQPLFDAGLEMVWQDMTTPCMNFERDTERKSFPLSLIVTNDSRKIYVPDPSNPDEIIAAPERTPAALARNLYAYNLVKATYHGLNNLNGRPAVRNFIIARGGFTGMHRFAALWTGDNFSDWPYLRLNILQALAGGLSGQPITGADIGGFASNKEREEWVDPELLMRWMIAGAFLPWFRNHYTKKAGSQKQFQEPYAFTAKRENVPENERWLYDAVLPVCRSFIELRYRLMQLFYDLMFSNTIDGLPIVRPLFVNDDQDLTLFFSNREFNDTQWFVGRDLLVAPVIEKQQAEYGNGKREVYLPAGSSWYAFQDNRQRLSPLEFGGQHFVFDARLSSDPEQIPYACALYVREGAVLPTIELEQFVGQRNQGGKPANPITLNIYPARRAVLPAEYVLYEDDGISRASAYVPISADGDPTAVGGDPAARGEFRQTRVTQRWVAADTRQVRLVRLNDGYTPAIDFMFIAVLHDLKEVDNATSAGPLSRVVRSGRNVTELSGTDVDALAKQLWDSSIDAFYFNDRINITFIKITQLSADEELTLAYTSPRN